MIYLDNAATTRISYNAIQAMEPYLNEIYGNPSGVYKLSRQAKEAIEEAREIIAGILKTNPENIFFTSGGTESDNWVLDNVEVGGHVITSSIEHHAILNKCKQLEEKGIEVTYLPVDKWGRVDPKDVENSIKDNTSLISIMMANNEIGTIEPISEIGMIAKKKGIRFHTDAVQAFGHIFIDVNDINVDMLSASSHKFNGPKGIGFLYVRDVDNMGPLILGGGQEMGMRAGTENVANIVGMGAAAKEAYEEMRWRIKKEIYLRNYLISRVLREIPRVRLNGSPNSRLPGNVNFSFEGVDGTSLVVLMDNEGICISAGSACSADKEGVSHVIEAIDVPENFAFGTVRLTLSSENTLEEMNFTIHRLKENVRKLRSAR